MNCAHSINLKFNKHGSNGNFRYGMLFAAFENSVVVSLVIRVCHWECVKISKYYTTVHKVRYFIGVNK